MIVRDAGTHLILEVVARKATHENTKAQQDAQTVSPSLTPGTKIPTAGGRVAEVRDGRDYRRSRWAKEKEGIA